MPYFELEPEEVGALGPSTGIDRTSWPPMIAHPTVEFDGWLGDDLVASFPLYLVTSPLAEAIESAGLTGVRLDDVVVTATEQYSGTTPRELPAGWRWLRPVGTAWQDDAWAGDKGILTVSAGFMTVLDRFRAAECYADEVTN